MKQTFKFNTCWNTYNDDTSEILIDFDEREVVLYDGCGNKVETLQVSRNPIELKRFHRAIGSLIEEMDE